VDRELACASEQARYSLRERAADQHSRDAQFREIGALSVGRIVQVHPVDTSFQRGEEKSVFRFGGSAIAVFGQAGLWRPSADMLENTAKGIETMPRLGEEVARAA